MPSNATLGRKAVILSVLAAVAVMFATSFLYRIENPNLFVKARMGSSHGNGNGAPAMAEGPMSKVREFMGRVEANPEDVEALVGLGNAFLMMRAWDRALESLGKARSLAPGNIRVLKGIGIAHFNMQAFDKAAESYEAILKIDAEDTLALFNLGVIYKHYFKKSDRARIYFEKVLVLEKDDAEMLKLTKDELGQ